MGGKKKSKTEAAFDRVTDQSIIESLVQSSFLPGDDKNGFGRRKTAAGIHLTGPHRDQIVINGHFISNSDEARNQRLTAILAEADQTETELTQTSPYDFSSMPRPHDQTLNLIKKKPKLKLTRHIENRRALASARENDGIYGSPDEDKLKSILKKTTQRSLYEKRMKYLEDGGKEDTLGCRLTGGTMENPIDLAYLAQLARSSRLGSSNSTTKDSFKPKKEKIEKPEKLDLRSKSKPNWSVIPGGTKVMGEFGLPPKIPRAKKAISINENLKTICVKDGRTYYESEIPTPTYNQFLPTSALIHFKTSKLTTYLSDETVEEEAKNRKNMFWELFDFRGFSPSQISFKADEQKNKLHIIGFRMKTERLNSRHVVEVLKLPKAVAPNMLRVGREPNGYLIIEEL